jgi:hypothetical protein
VKRQQEDEGANPDPARSRRNRRADRQKRRGVTIVDEMMLRQPDVIVPELFRVDGELDVVPVELGPRHGFRGGIPERKERSEFHHAPS